MVERKPVNVGVQVVLCIIPYLWIYGFYRIEKLQMGIVLAIVTLIPSFFMSMTPLVPYGSFITIFLGVVLPIAFIVYWSSKWNEQILSGVQEDEKSISPKSPLSILQERYAKGEITKEEFDKMKEDLS